MLINIKATALLCTLASVFSPTLAQAQTSQAYSNVRGWVVSSDYQNGSFIGCSAQQNTRADTWSVRTRNGGWEMTVPNYGPPNGFDGAVVTVDRTSIDAQFAYTGDIAYRELNSYELGLLKKGSRLTVRINGQDQQSYKLSGSTAAVLKVQECEQRRGNAQSAQATSPRRATPPPAPAPAPQQHSTSAHCSTYIGGSFQCNLIRKAPEAGYVDAFEIVSNQYGEPNYFFKVKNEYESDTWVSLDGGPWTYMGVWQPAPDGCSEPHPNQGSEARNNLGQDAWGLCVN